jgi:hypothetical protein
MPLKRTEVVDILTKVLTHERTRGFIEKSTFWPVAVKGGFECTLRDFVLFDLQRELARRFRGKAYLCTGERRWDRCKGKH